MKIVVLLISILLLPGVLTQAQTEGNSPVSQMGQAEKSFANGKFIEARYFYKRAYEGFATQSDYPQAIYCGLKADSLFTTENLYVEAFEICRGMEALIRDGESKRNTKFYDLRFLVSAERLRIYSRIKSWERAREQIYIIDEIGKQANDESLNEKILYAKANCYFVFGLADQGMDSYKKLINTYQEKGEIQKVKDCYKGMIELAEKVNNASLVVGTYKQYVAWSDSMKSVAAVNELAEVKQKYEDSQQTLLEKESSLSTRQYIIIGLCVLSALLIAGVVGLAFILLRYIWLTKRQKKNIEIANEHNQLKSQFIQNISAQMDPALNTLAGTTDALPVQEDQLEPIRFQINALRSFSNHMQELSSLESSLDELYELQDCYVNIFCEDVMRKVRPAIRPGVEAQVNAFKLQAKINPEHLEKVLIHLLQNAALYTETGKISLDFKKKGAHLHQFIVTDTGPGIPEEMRENLFKPFSEIKDLTKGDGLGLPICSLMTLKMNGALSLDPTYTRGSRFILDLRM